MTPLENITLENWTDELKNRIAEADTFGTGYCVELVAHLLTLQREKDAEIVENTSYFNGEDDCYTALERAKQRILNPEENEK